MFTGCTPAQDVMRRAIHQSHLVEHGVHTGGAPHNNNNINVPSQCILTVDALGDRVHLAVRTRTLLLFQRP